MADNHVMFNRKKVKSKTPVRDLMKEYFRDEKTADKYDNGVRNIDTSKTKDNVAIIKPPENFDRIRRERINQLSEERKKKGQRAMRSDTVDLIETVIQADSEMLKKMTREEQIKFYKTCIEVMQEDEKTYGKIDAAVIHFDETTTHAQVLSSTLDFENHKSRAKEMFGNRVKMSVDQTEFVHAIQKKGYTGVTRGVNRIDNNYKEQKERRENKYKIQINRHNEHIIDELEKDKQSIDGLKKDVVDGLVRDYPKMSIVRNKKTHESSEPFQSKVMQEELHGYSLENVLLLKTQLDEHMRKQREKKLKEREEKLKQQEEEQKKREDELRVREDGLIEKEQGLNERENVVNYTELGLERKEEEFDERLREKEESFNKMYERPTYYAFCEDIKNRYVKAKKKKHPDINVEGILYDKFKLDSYLVGSAEDIKIKRAREDLSVRNETTVNQPKVKKEKEGFDPLDDD